MKQWNYYKDITVTSDTELHDYQVKLDVAIVSANKPFRNVMSTL